jgi:hypothetical protein
MSESSPQTTDWVEITVERQARIKRRMDAIDSLPADVRAVVHEYGWEPVKLLMGLGVKKAGALEHIILACRGGGSRRDLVLDRMAKKEAAHAG